MRLAGMKLPTELAGPVEELKRQRLIEVRGAMEASMLPFASFAVLPSAKDYARYRLGL
jgi:hypothetical protein